MLDKKGTSVSSALLASDNHLISPHKIYICALLEGHQEDVCDGGGSGSHSSFKEFDMKYILCAGTLFFIFQSSSVQLTYLIKVS